MSAGFTPGPWCIAFEDEANGIPYIIIEAGEEGTPTCRNVCEVSATFVPDDKEGDDFILDDAVRANANLIAAAPDLYRDLCTALDLVRIKYGNLDAGVNKFVQRAETTLARVEAA